VSKSACFRDAQVSIEGVAEAQMVSHLVLQQLTVPVEGVRKRGRGREDEILYVLGKQDRRKWRRQVVAERNPEPELLQCRRYIELEDGHFVIRHAGEVLILVIGEVRHDVAEGVSGSIAETRLAGIPERGAGQAGVPDPADIAVRALRLFRDFDAD